jgi:L-arabinose isomerase
MAQVKVGLVGIGLETYWAQFEGLFERLQGYQAQILARIEACGAHVVDAGLVDSPQNSREAADLLRRE